MAPESRNSWLVRSAHVCVMNALGDPHLLYGSRLPLGRIATEDEIGRVALFRASDLAAIMTGSVAAADAGDLAV